MTERSYRSANEARRQRNAIASAEQQQALFHKQRHEALIAVVQTRQPLLRDESDLREQMLSTFRRSIVEIANWEAHLARTNARNDAKHAKLSDNVSRVVSLEIDRMCEEHDGPVFDDRCAVEVKEQKVRLTIRRMMQHDQYLIDCHMQQRRLINAERKLRDAFEAEQQFLRDEYQLAYDHKPWQPYAQVFGVCPFHKRADCPFSNPKKSQRVLHFPIDPEHHCRSV